MYLKHSLKSHSYDTLWQLKFYKKILNSLWKAQNLFNKGLFTLSFDCTCFINYFCEIKVWKKCLDGFVTGFICPALFCIHIYEIFRVFWIYITKTQVLIICGILCHILGSYLLHIEYPSGHYRPSIIHSCNATTGG